MEEEVGASFQDRFLEFAKKNWLILALLVGGVVFVGLGLIQMVGVKTASVNFEKGVDVAGISTSSANTNSTQIKVDVEGQVVNPGVYSLGSDSRVQDALAAAGGLNKSANRNALNLAQRVSDGQKVYVPAVGETVSSQSMGNMVGQGSMGGDSSNGLVSINSGTESELEGLPGVGPVTAGKIIAGRPYGSLEELTSKKAVGQATFTKIKDQISL